MKVEFDIVLGELTAESLWRKEAELIKVREHSMITLERAGFTESRTWVKVENPSVHTDRCYLKSSS